MGNLFSGMKFEPKAFIDNLIYMGEGMLCIFIVIAIVAVVTMLLNKVFSGKKKTE